ncbi:MAG: adenine-specific methyltransferase EcoRI family protein [Tissierellales bacterium]|nr:adenine-specific methyltransferase EcoRI family protein [Tissierellales bacterium]
MANINLSNAKKAKMDEFYTLYHNIEKEIAAYIEYNSDVFRGKTVLLPCDDPEWSNFTKFFAQNFERFGLKKLISTSYAVDSKIYKYGYQPTLFETNDPQFDKNKTQKNGKIFTLTHDKTGDGKIDVNDLEWHYLSGDGDFRSDEVKKLRDEAEIIITNPPFSLFRDFLGWVVEGEKQFLIIGNINAITYKELFPLIQEDKLWLGATNFNTGMYFIVPDDFIYADSYKFEREQNGEKVNRVPGVCWFTNLDHGRRHQPLPLMSMADNLKFSKHKEIRGKETYDQYENYDAIEVPFTDSIPSDYDGVMGVPISFLNKYNPEQFQIIWQASGNTRASAPKEILKRLNYRKHPEDRGGCTIVNGKRTYGRVLIKHRKVTI